MLKNISVKGIKFIGFDRAAIDSCESRESIDNSIVRGGQVKIGKWNRSIPASPT